VISHGVPVVVAVNAFKDDSPDELNWVCERAKLAGAEAAAVSTHWADGGRGAEELARAVTKVAAQGSQFKHLYDVAWPIKRKIETIATTMYGAGGVTFLPQAERDIELATRMGFDMLPLCMAKTPLSLSHEPSLKGRPSGFTVPIQELRILAGAGFLTAVCSGIQLMPGLPKRPAGERIDVDPQSGQIVGLA
jgi:formate--tetrahydrofolate ligase